MKTMAPVQLRFLRLLPGPFGSSSQVVRAIRRAFRTVGVEFSPTSHRVSASLHWAAVLLCAAALNMRADQITMQNGDRYAGKVLSLNADTLVVQSDLLGRVQLPRSKVALITLGAGAVTNRSRFPTGPKIQPSASSSTATNTVPELSTALRQLGAHTNLIQQVQNQFLAGAAPEANDKFNELLGGIMSGKLTLNDLRTEAKSAADQLRALKRDLGEDTGVAVDGYLAILDQFLKEVPPSNTSATNSSRSSVKPGPQPAGEER